MIIKVKNVMPVILLVKPVKILKDVLPVKNKVEKLLIMILGYVFVKKIYMKIP